MLLKAKQVNSLLVQDKKFADSYQPDQSAKLYRDILHRDPNNNDAYSGLLNVLLSSRKFIEAEKLIHSAENMHTAGIGQTVDLAQIFCAQQKWDDALGILKPALDKGTVNANGLYYFGQALKGRGELEESKPYFVKAIRKQPDYFEAYMSLCSLYYQMEKKDD